MRNNPLVRVYRNTGVLAAGVALRMVLSLHLFALFAGLIATVYFVRADEQC